MKAGRALKLGFMHLKEKMQLFWKMKLGKSRLMVKLFVLGDWEITIRIDLNILTIQRIV